MFEGLFQPMHLLVIAFIALLVFGPKKLPELGKGLGDGIKSFKDSMRQEDPIKKEETANTANHVLPVDTVSRSQQESL